MTQYRLKARAELNGAIREPGYIFTLGEGELGPHRTVVASNHGAQITDHMNAEQDLVDEPLYEEVKEPEPEPKKSADEIRAGLEAELAAAAEKLAAFNEQHPPEHGKPLLLEPPQSNLPARV